MFLYVCKYVNAAKKMARSNLNIFLNQVSLVIISICALLRPAAKAGR